MLVGKFRRDSWMVGGGSPSPRSRQCERRRRSALVVATQAESVDLHAQGFKQLGPDPEDAWFVVLGVGLDDEPLSGGGELAGDLHDGFLHGDGAAGEVHVAGPQGDELTPAQAGLDLGQDQRQEPVRDVVQEPLERLCCVEPMVCPGTLIRWPRLVRLRRLLVFGSRVR